MQESPLDNPPNSSDDIEVIWFILKVAAWVIGGIVTVVIPAISTVFAWWVKRDAQKQKQQADRDREAHERLVAEQESKRKIELQSYERRAEQQESFYSKLMEELATLRNENRDLRRSLDTIKIQMTDLKNKISYYENNPMTQDAQKILERLFDEGMLYPAWLRDVDNDKWYLNSSYCKKFHVIRKEFWKGINIYGQYDGDDALEYAQNDLNVLQNNTAVEFIENIRVRVLDPNCEEKITAKFRKTPMRIGDRNFIFGQMISEEV